MRDERRRGGDLRSQDQKMKDERSEMRDEILRVWKMKECDPLWKDLNPEARKKKVGLEKEMKERQKGAKERKKKKKKEEGHSKVKNEERVQFVGTEALKSSFESSQQSWNAKTTPHDSNPPVT